MTKDIRQLFLFPAGDEDFGTILYEARGCHLAKACRSARHEDDVVVEVEEGRYREVRHDVSLMRREAFL